MACRRDRKVDQGKADPLAGVAVAGREKLTYDPIPMEPAVRHTPGYRRDESMPPGLPPIHEGP